MFTGFELSDSLDWTALGTLLLAAVTTLSLAFGWKTLRQGQKEVEEAHRPVLVPVADGRTVMWRGEAITAHPGVPESGLLLVPVENIGTGPALRVDVRIEGINPADEVVWSGEQAIGVVMTAVGVAQGVTPLELDLPTVGDVPSFDLSLLYDDVAGKSWWTFTRWNAEIERYENVEIEERPRPRMTRCERVSESVYALRHTRLRR